MPHRTPLVVGNWKMNGLRASLREIEAIARYSCKEGVKAILCPPATLLAPAVEIVRATEGSSLQIGAQECHDAPKGAHTGDLSAQMLADIGAQAVIVGHCERRSAYAQSNEAVRARAQAAHRNALSAIICVGETADERTQGKALECVGAQLSGSLPEGATAADTLIAYEPVWAIGSGRTPTLEEIDAMHTFLRQELARVCGEHVGEEIRILYGGSLNPDNAAQIIALENVDGGLVGGASLTAESFTAILDQC